MDTQDNEWNDTPNRSSSPDRENDPDINEITDRDSGSRTFNEDEDTWEEEKRLANTSNQGTQNNDWDANDQMQRGPERSSAEDQRDASSSDYYSDRDEERRRNDNSSRSNNGDDF